MIPITMCIFGALFFVVTTYFVIFRFDQTEKWMRAHPRKTWIGTICTIVIFITTGLLALPYYEDKLPIDVRDVDTLEEFVLIEEHMPTIGPFEGAKTGRYYLLGDDSPNVFIVVGTLLKDDGNVELYFMENATTHRARILQKLYGEERVWKSGKEIQEHNQKMKEGG